MKKTKTICTIGPASNSVKVMTKLAHKGMNAVRVNMSHGDYFFAQSVAENLQKTRQQTKKAIALIVDTKGPEIRIGSFKNGFVELKKNQTFTLTLNEVEGNDNIVSLKHKHIINKVKKGTKIFANNGLIVLRVEELTNTDIICKVVFGGKLPSNKALNIPKISFDTPFLSKTDKQDLLFAIKIKANYIAASFVSCAQDVIDMKEFLKQNNGENIKILAKIESQNGVKNIKSILNNCDGIIVARGDLGVEIPFEKIPAIQKRAAMRAHKQGKLVVIATEMLESMITSLRPTRAEVSDIATAIYEKVTATMLSAESAVGINPENAVKTMTKIQLETEKTINYDLDLKKFNHTTLASLDETSQEILKTALLAHAKLILVFDENGQCVLNLSKLHIQAPILAITSNENVFHTLALNWNVLSHKLEKHIETESEMLSQANTLAKKLHLAKQGNTIVVYNANKNSEIKIVKVD
ncbi:MAG: pyruvate kinase [Christensenellales bacterium]|jgi:pyruvate kinase